MTLGFLVVDKPSGVTSTGVVEDVGRVIGMRKAGHAGTLDPMATGALVVALGPATRLIRYVQDQPKEYLATALFGVATDTLDADGAVLTREEMHFKPAELEAVVPRFVGTISQVPPMVSALKQGGRRLYELAREGQVVEREARSVEVHELELLSVGPGPYPEVTFRVVCGKGVYVRSLADDMASVLGGAAHVTALHRTRIGSLRADRGVAFDHLDDWKSHLLTPSEALADLPSVTVDLETARAVGHGMRFVGEAMGGAPEGIPFRVLDPAGSLLAVYTRSGEQARPEVVLPT
jgi:tRNA pseudouridine55 synthase